MTKFNSSPKCCWIIRDSKISLKISSKCHSKRHRSIKRHCTIRTQSRWSLSKVCPLVAKKNIKGRLLTIMFSLSGSESTNSNRLFSPSKIPWSISSQESVPSFSPTPAPHKMNCTINRRYRVCSTRVWLQSTPLSIRSLSSTCLRP